MNNDEKTPDVQFTEIEQNILDLLKNNNEESKLLVVTLLKDSDNVSINFLEQHLEKIKDQIDIEEIELFAKRLYKHYYEEEMKLLNQVTTANGKDIQENTNE